ncbi:hypothetical protein P9654_09625 [Bacillus atrophaeus]|uniref:hypothetical protein n=1 Tax=Bacillus atrophaeus TaxID=1452 RepID=UPI00077A3DE7|nr:hypothetical protein [Bacillus atrophaeus]KXZ16466.1 hypothetical protein AXI57_05370 [Bacillus atrophaeus]MCY8947757.1 hypothetical protein [Bacillus atrophaeus]MCY9204123.1 hypothetical protein [Bacillus atrophaeus]MEC0885065.1 hypothetical protein [Bacillus atrophaeus]MED4565053.1 hypothetical protein [Bacillus atrophaeus]
MNKFEVHTQLEEKTVSLQAFFFLPDPCITPPLQPEGRPFIFSKHLSKIPTGRYDRKWNLLRE